MGKEESSSSSNSSSSSSSGYSANSYTIPLLDWTLPDLSTTELPAWTKTWMVPPTIPSGYEYRLVTLAEWLNHPSAFGLSMDQIQEDLNTVVSSFSGTILATYSSTMAGFITAYNSFNVLMSSVLLVKAGIDLAWEIIGCFLNPGLIPAVVQDCVIIGIAAVLGLLTSFLQTIINWFFAQKIAWTKYKIGSGVSLGAYSSLTSSSSETSGISESSSSSGTDSSGSVTPYALVDLVNYSAYDLDLTSGEILRAQVESKKVDTANYVLNNQLSNYEEKDSVFKSRFKTLTEQINDLQKTLKRLNGRQRSELTEQNLWDGNFESLLRGNPATLYSPTETFVANCVKDAGTILEDGVTGTGKCLITDTWAEETLLTTDVLSSSYLNEFTVNDFVFVYNNSVARYCKIKSINTSGTYVKLSLKTETERTFGDTSSDHDYILNSSILKYSSSVIGEWAGKRIRAHTSENQIFTKSVYKVTNITASSFNGRQSFAATSTPGSISNKNYRFNLTISGVTNEVSVALVSTDTLSTICTKINTAVSTGSFNCRATQLSSNRIQIKSIIPGVRINISNPTTPSGDDMVVLLSGVGTSEFGFDTTTSEYTLDLKTNAMDDFVTSRASLYVENIDDLISTLNYFLEADGMTDGFFGKIGDTMYLFGYDNIYSMIINDNSFSQLIGLTSGSDVTLTQSTSFTLTGTAKDTDGSTISSNYHYIWRLKSKPDKSELAFDRQYANSITIEPDVAGEYVFIYGVSNTHYYDEREVTVYFAEEYSDVIKNIPPTAQVTNNLYQTSSSVSLTAETFSNNSYYSWEIASQPSSSNVSLSSIYGQSTSFTATHYGMYELNLTAGNTTSLKTDVTKVYVYYYSTGVSFDNDEDYPSISEEKNLSAWTYWYYRCLLTWGEYGHLRGTTSEVISDATDRLTEISGDVTDVEDQLDSLYDKREAIVNARTNDQSGTISMIKNFNEFSKLTDKYQNTQDSLIDGFDDIIVKKVMSDGDGSNTLILDNVDNIKNGDILYLFCDGYLGAGTGIVSGTSRGGYLAVKVISPSLCFSVPSWITQSNDGGVTIYSDVGYSLQVSSIIPSEMLASKNFRAVKIVQ